MYEISKTLEIDAAHRVPFDESKCRYLHGHRYKIEAVFHSPILQEKAQTGMVTNFSFMKQAMREEIDSNCDHATILWQKDPYVRQFVGATCYDRYIKESGPPTPPTTPWECWESFKLVTGTALCITLQYGANGGCLITQRTVTGTPDPYNVHSFRLYLLPEVPTAENLAKHWYDCLEAWLERNLNEEQQVKLARVIVYETATCKAVYFKEVQ